MRMERGILSPYYETAEKYVCDTQRYIKRFPLYEYKTEIKLSFLFVSEMSKFKT